MKELKDVLGNRGADGFDVHFGLEIELEMGSVAENQRQLAVDIQHTGGFDSEILHLGIGIGKIKKLFPVMPCTFTTKTRLSVKSA